MDNPIGPTAGLSGVESSPDDQNKAGSTDAFQQAFQQGLMNIGISMMMDGVSDMKRALKDNG
jgi:hypothetical protein